MYDYSFRLDERDRIDAELDRRAPMSIEEALDLVEFQVQCYYSFAPELHDAIHVLSACVERERELEEALRTVVSRYATVSERGAIEVAITSDLYRMIDKALKGGDRP